MWQKWKRYLRPINKLSPHSSKRNAVFFVKNNKEFKVEFSQVMAAFAKGEHRIHEGWSQGRACFEGLIGAVRYAELARLEPDRPLRSLILSLLGHMGQCP